MKQIKLLLIGLLLSISSFAQQFYKVLDASYATYTDDYGWKTQSTNIPKHIFAIFNDRTIKITNEDESLFVTYGEPLIKTYSTHTATIWDAYDKQGRDCTVMIRSSNTSCVLSIIYNRVSFDYTLKIEK